MAILVNGLPLIPVELKRRGVPIREAFNQINRYQWDSFWAASGLYQFVQIFVISNGTNTKYYSNTTRFNPIKDAASKKAKREKTSNRILNSIKTFGSVIYFMMKNPCYVTLSSWQTAHLSWQGFLADRHGLH